MELSNIRFHRRFSVNFYRNLRLDMGHMSFFKDWVTDKRGDPYPILQCVGDVREAVGQGVYNAMSEHGGFVRRLLGSFFPWNTYEICIKKLSDAAVGFCLSGDAGDLSVLLDTREVTVSCGEQQIKVEASVRENAVFAVTFRTSGISLYLDGRLLCDLSLDMLDAYRKEEFFERATVSLQIRMNENAYCTLDRAEWYLCGGISHADIKPIRYEDGTPMIERGRLYLTVSSRLEVGAYQSILSWNPTLCDFRMEGAIFFDAGDGYWCSDVASSIIFDRNRGEWLIWHCSFSHGHVLGRGICPTDPRFGIHVINTRLMEHDENAVLTDFVGIAGDEDPDLVYLDGQWHLAICRPEPNTGYHYYHFVSDDPFDGFVYVDRTPTGEKTGGMFVKTENGYSFACGSDFASRSRYDIYPIENFSVCGKLQCDYDDGGFRGWGSIMLLPIGGRKRYVWITFDRHNGSRFNWSYGNLYVFDSDWIKL